MKGKALKRALASSDAGRIGGDVPLIVDRTEFITPESAQAMLEKNTSNRPVNWRRVEQYAETMRAGGWKLHAQGIVLDPSGNLLTGQNRLWAIIYSGQGQHMRVSRGSPPDVAPLLDRGQPQSARDLASRRTRRKHSPMESAIARAICALRGSPRPSADELAAVMENKEELMRVVLQAARGENKTRALLMILAVLCEQSSGAANLEISVARASHMAEVLELKLAPEGAKRCWGKGTAFRLAMEQARMVVAENA